ncbi:MAG TPA: glycosyltransferase family 39 protein [Urbifossiella sp.]|nr:glycosyltransferase family 39 protein [Urbifossiella sp.]
MAGVVGARLGPAVGGRLEAVARKRVLAAPDYLRLGVLLLVAAAVHLWLVTHTATTARDGIGFARYAINLQSPHQTATGHDPARTVLQIVGVAQHPPAYPVAIWAVAKVVRRMGELPLPEAYLLAAQIVSAAAGVLLVVPTYLTGRMLFGRSAGFAAALLLQVLPTPARLTSDALTEGMYLFGASTAVMLGVRAVRRPTVGGFLLCGLATGFTYLVRPEGLLIAAGVGVTAVALLAARRWPLDLTLGRLAGLTVGVALVAGPYMAVINGLTNKTTGKDMLNPSVNPRANLFNQGPKAEARPVVAAPLFAEWREGGENPVVWAAGAVVVETVKALYYVPAVLALLGVVLLRRRVAADPGLWCLLILAGLSALLLTVVGIKAGYVSERHTLLLVMIGCVFAAAALEPVALLLRNRVRAEWLLVGIAVAAIPATLKPLHANREGFKHAGRWMAENVTPADCVIDPFEWAQFYSGRSLYGVPPDPEKPVNTFAVVDDRTRADEHVRLPRLDLAIDVLKNGNSRVVYHWPENVPESEAKVKVYRLTRSPE